MSQRNIALSGRSAPSKSNNPQPLPPIRPTHRRSGNLLMNVSIGTRLTLSFIMAALIAALVTGTIGFQHAQSLNKQSNFYLNLLQSNNNLTTGEQFLQAITSVTQNILVQASVQQSSQETLRANLNSLQNLDNLYSSTLNSFVASQLVSKHPDGKALLEEAKHGQQTQQQETLAASALRTWQVAHTALGKFMGDVTAGRLDAAALLQQALLEPANADALTSLRSLVNFNKRLANSVKDAADVEAHDQLIATIISSVIAFVAILLIGWLISGTLVRRLLSLRQVTQAVGRGELTRRVKVVGRDEIAEVSASVNAMLDAIALLVNETRSQRDALMNAADHLFSDMRIVSSGDLRVNTSANSDPISILADAFNFTIGRFRRFVLRTKTLSEQLNVVAHRETERAKAFSQALQSIQPASDSQHFSASSGEFPSTGLGEKQMESHTPITQLIAHIRRTRVQLRNVSQEGILNHTRVAGELSEQITKTLKRLSGIVRSEQVPSEQGNMAIITKTYMQELRTLDSLLTRMAIELQSVQRNTLEGFQDLDQGLQQLSMSVGQVMGQGSVEGVSSAVITEQDPRLQEVVRLGVTFAQEVTSLSHQLTKLSQEMQKSVASFQFEGNDPLMNSPAIKSPNTQANISWEHSPAFLAERGVSNIRA